MSYSFKTKTFVAQDADAAIQAAKLLVVGSCWFELTPIPDDRYEFVVKDEEAGSVRILRLLGLKEV